MAQVVIGKGIVFGVTGADNFYTSASVKYQKADLKDDFEKKYVHDEQGNTVGIIGLNGKKTITIDLIPCAPPAGGIAASAAQIKLPAKLATVALSAFIGAGALFNGNWIYEGGGYIALLNEDVVKITLPLVQFDTDLTATPVS